ncbi:MAG TPA: hypothetical protein VGO11_14890 [Chthoniobacteraceae bacterium]|jgi:hypothetical protein|nr:hypothetical protein [Chthoniobacteraceae bacterium]
MKGLVALAVRGLTQLAARAQFYAPPVDFHDVAQRRFPVEAARVPAWLQDQQQAGVTEITCEVKTSGAPEIVWSFEWKKADGPSRKAVDRYPESALRNAPMVPRCLGAVDRGGLGAAENAGGRPRVEILERRVGGGDHADGRNRRRPRACALTPGTSSTQPIHQSAVCFTIAV